MHSLINYTRSNHTKFWLIVHKFEKKTVFQLSQFQVDCRILNVPDQLRIILSQHQQMNLWQSAVGEQHQESLGSSSLIEISTIPMTYHSYRDNTQSIIITKDPVHCVQ